MLNLMLDDGDPRRHMSSVKRLKIYRVDNIVVSTAYNESTQMHDTIVVHPFYDNEIILVDQYENSVDAESGHDHWCVRAKANRLPSKKSLLITRQANPVVKVIRPIKTEYKISLFALMRIFVPYSILGNQLKVTKLSNKPGYMLMTIVKGDHKGALVYNHVENVATNITSGWSREIQKQIDHASEKIMLADLDEEEEMEQERQFLALQQTSGIDQAGIPY